MTKDDKEFLKEFLNGFLTFCGVVAVLLVLAYFLIILSSGTKTPPNERFQVVDTYKGCDLVRWADNQVATYKYFLYCPK